nr:hypothetical protein Iba_chr06eCG2330 [Ipomoea batatas]
MAVVGGGSGAAMVEGGDAAEVVRGVMVEDGDATPPDRHTSPCSRIIIGGLCWHSGQALQSAEYSLFLAQETYDAEQSGQRCSVSFRIHAPANKICPTDCSGSHQHLEAKKWLALGSESLRVRRPELQFARAQATIATLSSHVYPSSYDRLSMPRSMDD